MMSLSVAQFCVNNWGDDIPATRRQFFGGYKLLYLTLLNLGGGPSLPVPPRELRLWSLLSSKVKRPKLMPFKILMCSEPNETIIH